MPFFRYLYFSIIYISKTYKMNKPSLRVKLPVISNHIVFINQHHYSEKRVSSFASNGRFKASMTIEAALVLPTFLFAMLSLISIFNVMKLKGCMDVAVAEAGNEISIENYGEYVGDLLVPVYIRMKIDTFLNKNLSKEDIDKLSDYIFVTDISFTEEENIVAFRVDYKVIPDFGMLGLIPVKLHTTYYGYSWLGYESTEESEKMVFISKNASVYHLDKDCTYLNIEIRQVPYSSLEEYRNGSGKKYGVCGFCKSLPNNGTIYITSEGENYHTIETCIGLTRSIYTVPLSTVSDKRSCTRCGE